MSAANRLMNKARKLLGRKNFRRAEGIYQRVLVMQPRHIGALLSYAQLLRKISKDPRKAEVYYIKALDANPLHADGLLKFALFLEEDREDWKAAQSEYERALSLEPNNPGIICNYAVFHKNMLRDYDRAEELYKRALDVDPTHLNSLGNYAIFCQHIKKDPKEAERYYLKVLEAAQEKAMGLAFWSQKYAEFLESLKPKEDYYRRPQAPEKQAGTKAGGSGKKARKTEGQRDEHKKGDQDEKWGLISMQEKRIMTQYFEGLFQGNYTTTEKGGKPRVPLQLIGGGISQLRKKEHVGASELEEAFKAHQAIEMEAGGESSLDRFTQLLSRLFARKHFIKLLNKQRALVSSLHFWIFKK